MGKLSDKKIKSAVKNGRLSKVKKLLEQHQQIDLKSVLSKNRQNLLHLAAKNGHDFVIRFLVKHGVSVTMPDKRGNTPAHLALFYCLSSRMYSEASDMLDPLVSACPDLMFTSNRDNVTPLDLLTQLENRATEKRKTRQNLFPEESSNENAERSRQVDDWSDRISAEVEAEYEEEWGRYETDFQADSSPPRETFDEWCERIARERRRLEEPSMRQSGPHTSPVTDLPGGQTEDHGDERTRRDDQAYRQRLEAALQERTLGRQYTEFKRRWLAFLSATAAAEKEGAVQLYGLADIPWPPFLVAEEEGLYGQTPTVLDSVRAVMGGDESVRSELKELRVDWHPDRFAQKFASRIALEDRENIDRRVNQVSQLVNQALQQLAS